MSSSEAPSPWFPRLAAGLLFVVAAANGWRFLGHVCDDAVISFRSVANFGLGHGLVYNVGEQVETYTNLGLVWLLVVAQAVGIDLFTAATAIGYAAALGAVAATWWLARALLPGTAALAPLLLVATSTTLLGQAGSGLETTLAACCVTAGLARLLRECRADADATAGPGTVQHGLGLAVLALGAWVRIDCVLVLGGAWLLKLVWCGPGWRRRASGFDTVALLLGLAIPTLFRFAYYGSVVPNPVLAKFGLEPDLRIYKNGVNYLLEWLRTDLCAPVLVGGVLFALGLGRGAQALAVLVGGWLLFVVTSGGDHMPYHRFVAPMLPTICVLAMAGWHHALLGSRATPSRGLTATLAAAVLALAVEPVIASQSRGNIPQQNAALEGYRRELGEFFAQQASGRSQPLVVAGGAAGYMGFFAGPNVRFVDILGLTDAAIARHGRRDPRMPPGHQAGDGRYVLAQRPDFVVFGSSTPGDRWQRPDAGDLLERIGAVGAEAWAKANDHRFAVSEAELLDAAEFRRDYELVQVTLGSGRVFRLCRRR